MSKKNYTKDENGFQKMRALIDTPKIIMMATMLEKIPFSVCPMTLQAMDEQGDLWFFSAKDSDHFRDIEQDNRVQLIYTDEQNQKYISIFGNATHIVSEKKVQELWNKNLNTWFDGPNDPNLVLLNVNMENAYYWDSTNSKLVSFFEKVAESGNKGYVDLQEY